MSHRDLCEYSTFELNLTELNDVAETWSRQSDGGSSVGRESSRSFDLPHSSMSTMDETRDLSGDVEGHSSAMIDCRTAETNARRSLPFDPTLVSNVAVARQFDGNDERRPTVATRNWSPQTFRYEIFVQNDLLVSQQSVAPVQLLTDAVVECLQMVQEFDVPFNDSRCFRVRFRLIHDEQTTRSMSSWTNESTYQIVFIPLIATHIGHRRDRSCRDS